MTRRKGSSSPADGRGASPAADAPGGVRTGATGAPGRPGEGAGAMAPDVALAIRTLHLVCEDAEAPAAARAQAARTLLEMAGALRGEARSGPVPGAEMTPGEVDEALASALARERDASA